MQPKRQLSKGPNRILFGEHGATLNLIRAALVPIFGQLFGISAQLLPVRCKHVRSDSVQPRKKRRALPSKVPKRSQRLMEYFRGQVLCFFTCAHAAEQKRINPMEVALA